MARTPKPWYREERQEWCVTVGGKRRVLARGARAKTKGAAQREFHRLMLAEGRAVETDGGRMLVRDVFNLYSSHAEGRAARGEMARETYDAYRKHLFSATEAIGSIRAADVLPKDLLRWVDKRTWGSTMRHSALTVAKIAFRWARKVGHIAVDPIAGMEMPRPKVREVIPTAEQVEAIFKAAWGQPFRDLLLALRETGCRPSEIATLTADRVNLATGIWRVKNKTRHQTGEEFRTVYLNPAMIALSRTLLAKHPEGLVFRNSHGGRWAKGVISYRFVRLQRKLGFGPECSAYAFRHLYITDALQRGVDPASVAELVGHASLKMIMKVYNKLGLRGDHLRDAAARIRPLAAPSPPPSLP